MTMIPAHRRLKLEDHVSSRLAWVTDQDSLKEGRKKKSWGFYMPVILALGEVEEEISEDQSHPQLY